MYVPISSHYLSQFIHVDKLAQDRSLLCLEIFQISQRQLGNVVWSPAALVPNPSHSSSQAVFNYLIWSSEHHLFSFSALPLLDDISKGYMYSSQYTAPAQGICIQTAHYPILRGEKEKQSAQNSARTLVDAKANANSPPEEGYQKRWFSYQLWWSCLCKAGQKTNLCQKTHSRRCENGSLEQTKLVTAIRWNPNCCGYAAVCEELSSPTLVSGFQTKVRFSKMHAEKLQFIWVSLT